MKPTPVEERTWMLRLADCALPEATLPEPSPDPLPDLPVQSPPALSFYVVESSIAFPGAEESDSFRERVGFVHVTIDRDEVRRLVTEEVKRFRDEYADVDLEPTIGVWTVQIGVLTSFLDLTDASPVDRPAVSARLPALLAPVAEVDYDDLLDVRVPDPHPAPDIETWLGCDQELLYGENVL
jgi:hypothetical protein